MTARGHTRPKSVVENDQHSKAPRVNQDIVGQFCRAVEAGDADGALASLAEGITLNHPLTYVPFQGRNAVGYVLPRLLAVWQDLHYTARLEGDSVVGLVFEARVGGREVAGVDLLRRDQEGLITEITVTVRPLTGLQALAREIEVARATATEQAR
jgi:hypothetical protein